VPDTARWSEFVDTAASTEHERMALMERVFDPYTLRLLDRVGLAPGWRCLEVGAGGGSVAAAMAERAGAATVVATDLSIALLGPLAELGVTVLRHDVTADPAPGEFDLIHCRFVLEHLPARAEALRRMVSWLRPGGRLLVETGSSAPELSSRPEVRRAMAASNAALAARLGTDPAWARTLPLPLEAAGLADCGTEGVVHQVRGRSPMAHWLRAAYRLADEATIAAGTLSRADLELAYACYDDESFVDYTWLTIAAWGHRPA
jgi:SAM-dependent methyltransferase